MSRYSEEDLQSYAEGSFTGDAEGIKTFIAQNPAAAESVDLYKQLFAAFVKLYQADREPVNLPRKVALLVQAKQQPKESRWLTVGIGALVLVAIGMFAKNFVYALPAYTMPVAAAVVIMALFVWLSAKIEIAERKRIFTFPAS